ncbi:type II toxin-antitoxin system TacA family antitoxin [Steroidobacter gossypii]|nr:DUF1778 domain-containing protein [Steroidobacter gossypii]
MRDSAEDLIGPMATRRARKKKEHPLSMRLPEADIAIIDRAASVRGRSRTDFVREAAVRAAEEVLMERVLVRMSPSGFNAFVKALAEPAIAPPEMLDLLGRPAPWEVGDSRK